MSTPPGMPPDPQEPEAPRPPDQPEQSGRDEGTSSSPFAGLDTAGVTSAFSRAHRFDLGIVAAGVLTFFFSLLPYYSYEFKGFEELGVSIGGASDSVTAWHGFFGWFGALVALAVAVVVALHIVGVRLPVPTRLVALAGFGVALLCVLLALFIVPGGGCQGIAACEDAIDFGHGFGYWLSWLSVLAGLVLSFLRKDATD